MTGGSSDAPPLSISACTTWRSTYDEDVRIYSAAGVSGIGLWEFKLPAGRDEESAELLTARGLKATFCFPEVPSIFPGGTLFREPRDRDLRAKRLQQGIRRLARFDPIAVICYAGPPGDLEFGDARALVVDSLRDAGRVAEEAGVRLALEVLRPGFAPRAEGTTDTTIVSTVREAVELIDDIGLTNIDILIDTWHFWDDPTAARDIARFAERIVGVQLADRRKGARGTMDRSLPGEGDLDLRALVRMIRSTSFRGWYDLEIMSDDGTFGNAYADSLWKVEPERLVRAGVASFEQLWNESGARA